MPGDSPQSTRDPGALSSPPDDQPPPTISENHINGVTTGDASSKRDSRGNPNPVGRFPLRKPPPSTGSTTAGAAGGGGRVAGMIANMNHSTMEQPGNRDSVGSLGGAGVVEERRGVSLEDKPMDD